jgi:hypothetical protein
LIQETQILSSNADLFMKLLNFERSGVLDPIKAKIRLLDEMLWFHILAERISSVVYVDGPCPEDNGISTIRGQCCIPSSEFEPVEIVIFKQPAYI